MRVLILGLCFLSFGMMSFAGDVLAEEWIWKFNVPVEVKHMPEEATGVRVHLMVMDHKSGWVAFGSEGEPLDSDGNFSGIISVLVYPSDLKMNRRPDEAVKYEAELRFAHAGGHGTHPNKSFEWTKSKNLITKSEPSAIWAECY